MKRLIAFFLCVAALVGCANKTAPTLYQQIDGREGVENIVDSFINQIGHDKQVFHYFKHANVTYFRHGFIKHLCALTGGPCNYDGDSMIAIHTGMNITEKDFNHVVDLLINAMNEQNIPHTVQNKILSKMAPLRGEIIKI